MADIPSSLYRDNTAQPEGKLMHFKNFEEEIFFIFCSIMFDRYFTTAIHNCLTIIIDGLQYLYYKESSFSQSVGPSVYHNPSVIQ